MNKTPHPSDMINKQTNNMKTMLTLIGYVLIFAGYALAILGTTFNNEVAFFFKIIVTLMTIGMFCVGLPKIWDDIQKVQENRKRGSED